MEGSAAESKGHRGECGKVSLSPYIGDGGGYLTWGNLWAEKKGLL